MEIISWISPILNILSILAIIAGMWFARKILPTLIARIHARDLQIRLSRPFVKVILWLALGTLFSFPLIDLISWLGNFMNLAFVPQAGSNISTLFGTIPQGVYFAFFLLLMLSVYGVILWLAMDYLSTPGQFKKAELIFMVLTIASLVHQGIRIIFVQVFSFQIPILQVQQNYGIPGFLLEVLVGLVILTLILIGVNKVIPNQPDRGK